MRYIVEVKRTRISKEYLEFEGDFADIDDALDNAKEEFDNESEFNDVYNIEEVIDIEEIEEDDWEE